MEQSLFAFRVAQTSITVAPAGERRSLRQTNTKPGYDRSLLVFTGIVALGVIALAFLPIYYTNLTSRADGTMRVYPVSDVLFHIAIANELTHTVRPKLRTFQVTRWFITTQWIWWSQCLPKQRD